MKPSRNPYLFPFLMVASLFFIWGFCHAMLDVLNKHFQNLLNVSKAQSGLIQTAFFMAYLLMAFPAALMIRRIGFQRGILVGLAVLANRAFPFIPAGRLQTCGAFFFSLFLLSAGLACIETAANPYVTVLCSKEGGAARLLVAQAFNSCAYILAPTVGGFLIFGHKVDAYQPGFSFASPSLHCLGLCGAGDLRGHGVDQAARQLTVWNLRRGTRTPLTIKVPLSRVPHFKVGSVHSIPLYHCPIRH